MAGCAVIRLDTPGAVRRFLGQEPTRDQQGRIYRALWDARAISHAEARLLGTPCTRCGAVDELCAAETGLPASGPHAERIRA